MRRFALAFLALGIFPAAFSLAAIAQQAPNWSYQGKTGPVFWSKISPAYSACHSGREQSPVDIRNARLNKALPPLDFHFLAGPVTLTNTGNGIEARVDPGTFLDFEGTRYELQDFTFHAPSEHTVHSKLSDMEIDMMFRGAEGRQAGVAVFLNENASFPNATLATLWEHLPAKRGESERIAAMVNPGGLLPGDLGYWTYMGSELTPPCSEGVRWFVLEQPITISRSQYNAFTALYRRNTRPTEDLRGQKIQANE